MFQRSLYKTETTCEILQQSQWKYGYKILRDFSHNYVPKNAFYELDMGGDPHGICPSEILHTLWLVIFKYNVKYVIGDNLQPSMKKTLDKISKKVITECSHQEDRYVPRTNFFSGISYLSKITGGEYSGVILIMLIIILCPSGKYIYWIWSFKVFHQ